MLDILAQGKKPEGAARRPTQTAQALAGYLLTLTSPKTLTVREAAAILDRDVRSVKTAVGALKGYGIDGLAWADSEKSAFSFLAEAGSKNCEPAPESIVLDEGQEPVEAPAIVAQEVAFEIPDAGEIVEYIPETLAAVETDQLSLFGGFYEPMPVYNDYEPFTVAASRVRAKDEKTAEAGSKNCEPAPGSILLDEGQEPVEAPAIAAQEVAFDIPDEGEVVEYIPETLADKQTLNKPCTNIAQGLRKDCTKDVKSAGLEAAMEKLAATFDKLPNISTRTDAQARAKQRNNQENNLNQRIKENKQEQSSIQCEQKFIFIPDKEKPPKEIKGGGTFDPAAWRRVDDEIARLAPNAADWLRHRIAGLVAWGGITEDEYEAAIYPIKFNTSNIGNKGAYLNAMFEKFFKSRKWRKSNE